MLKPEKLSIPGPAGALEAIVEAPDHIDRGRFGVVCHPHPLQGGAMTNKVVHTVARAMNELGIPTIRFNFRGVGGSEGAFADGVGETDDALAVIEYGRARWPGAALWLGGFSFGGGVAIRAAARTPIQQLIVVAPAVRLVNVEDAAPRCPILVVQGDADATVDPGSVLSWAASLKPPAKVALLAGVEHFFHGRLNDLRETVLSLKQSC
jgi:alpha/beta superfamily hydrolase